MTILGLQRRIREIGRIRMGVQAATRTGKRAPKKIDKFRLTSPDRAVIEAAASIYGGTVHEWDNDGATQFEVITDATELRIALPPNPTDMAFSQHYEQWAKGFCGRRCNGQWDSIRDRACDCDPEDRACKATTRLSVLLPDIAGLGVWRLESHGYYAAVELAGAVDLISQMAGVHSVIPARLRLDQRETRKLVRGKPEVFKYAVPVIDLDVSILSVRSIAAQAATHVALEAGDEPPAINGWQPVPHVEPPEVLSVESQIAALDAPKAPAKKRANAAAPLPATGRTPRTAAEVEPQICSVCDKPYGAEALKPNPDKSPGQSRFVHRNHDQPAKEVAGDGGTSSSPRSTAQPSVPGPRPMSANQHAKVMALGAKAFPAEERKGPEADAWRRRNTLTLCSMLGMPPMTSRAELDSHQASALIDALVHIEAGEWTWSIDDDGVCHLVENEDGEPLGSEPLQEDDR